MRLRAQRITVAQYASNVFQWNWCADGVPVDFTGCTGRLTLRLTPDFSTPALVLSSATPTPNGSSIVLGTPTNALGPGLITLTIAPLDAASLTAAGGKYVGDLLVTMTDGSVVEIAALDVRVHQGSTY